MKNNPCPRIARSHVELIAEIEFLESKCKKLKMLLLLTDECVSRIAVGVTQIKQWGEFCRCFPDEGC